jgi:hypothetical protein
MESQQPRYLESSQKKPNNNNHINNFQEPQDTAYDDSLLEEQETNTPPVNIDEVCKITHPHELTAIFANMAKKTAKNNKKIAKDIFKNALQLPNLSDKDLYIIIEHMVDAEMISEAEQQARKLKNFLLHTLAWKIIIEKLIEKKLFKKAKKAAKYTGSKNDEQYYLEQIEKKQVSQDKIPALTPSFLESGLPTPSQDPLLS